MSFLASWLSPQYPGRPRGETGRAGCREAHGVCEGEICPQEEEVRFVCPSARQGRISRDKTMLSADWLLQLRAQIRMEPDWADLGPSLLLSQTGFRPAESGRLSPPPASGTPVHTEHSSQLRLPELQAPCGVDEENLRPLAAPRDSPSLSRGPP